MFWFYLNSKHKSRKVLIIHAHQNCSHAYVCFLQTSYICIPFICFYLALQILPVWFFLVACFSPHCLFCHFTLSRSGLSRFPPPVTWPSVPLCSLKHIALINSLCIYNPSSLCLICQIAIGYLYTSNRIKMPQINIPIRISRPERVGINPFVNWLQDKLITDCFLAVFLQCMPSVLMQVLGDVHVSSFSNYGSFLYELSHCHAAPIWTWARTQVCIRSKIFSWTTVTATLMQGNL